MSFGVSFQSGREHWQESDEKIQKTDTPKERKMSESGFETLPSCLEFPHP